MGSVGKAKVTYKESANIGKEATIKTGMYKGEWGIIKDFDGEYYHVSLWGGDDSQLVFEPSEISIKKEKASTADFSQGYTNATAILRSQYRNTQEMQDAGFRAVNDFSLSALLKEGNGIASDNQPWNNKVVYFIWDKDFKRWVKAAERSY